MAESLLWLFQRINKSYVYTLMMNRCHPHFKCPTWWNRGSFKMWGSELMPLFRPSSFNTHQATLIQCIKSTTSFDVRFNTYPLSPNSAAKKPLLAFSSLLLLNKRNSDKAHSNSNKQNKAFRYVSNFIILSTWLKPLVGQTFSHLWYKLIL